MSDTSYEYINDVTISGDKEASDIGTHTAVVAPKPGIMWTDGSTDSKRIDWYIERSESGVPVPLPLTYTGSAISPEWSDYDKTKIAIVTATTGINVGTYSTQWKIIDAGFTWEDGSTGTQTVQWSISPKPIPYPYLDIAGFKFTGTTITPDWKNYSETELTGTGLSATPSGTYTATFTPTNNYCWEDDGSKATYHITWTIAANVVDFPTYDNLEFTYSGEMQKPTFIYDSELVTAGGIIEASEIGTYTARFTLSAGSYWVDNTDSVKTITWEITRAIIDMYPTPSDGPYYYTGATISPDWLGYDMEAIIVTGDSIRATNVGTYTTIFTPRNNYMWRDHTTGSYEVEWEINKGNPVIQTTRNILNFSSESSSDEFDFYVSNNANTLISLNYSDGLAVPSTVATAWVSVNTIKVNNACGSSLADVKVNLNLLVNDDNWERTVKMIPCSYTADGIPAPAPVPYEPVLDEIPFSEMMDIFNSGEGSTYFNVGDVRSFTMKDGSVFKFQIAGFNHDQLSTGGVSPVTFISEKSHGYTTVFDENKSNTQGYLNSEPHKYLNTTIRSNLPDELMAYIKAVRKNIITPNSYNSSKDWYNPDFTTVDLDLWLPSFQEVNILGNIYKGIETGNARYDLFRYGRSQDREHYTDVTDEQAWWLRDSVWWNGVSWWPNCPDYYVGSGFSQETVDYSSVHGPIHNPDWKLPIVFGFSL